MSLIFRKELRLIGRSGIFRLGGGLLLVLLAMSVLTSYSYYQRMSRQHREAQQVARQQWESQGPANPHNAAHYGTYAFKPWSPLSLVDQGLNRYLGVSVFLEAHHQNFAAYKAIEDSHALARFGDISPTFVLVYLLPLLLMLLAFDLVGKEQREGTLRLQLSQGATARQVMLGKWLAVMAVGAGVLAVFALVASVLLGASGGRGEDYLRLALLTGALLLYAGVFVQVGLLLSARSRSSNASLVGAVACWMLCCLIVPKAISYLSAMQYPSPSAEAFRKDLRRDLDQGIDGHDPFNVYAQAFQDSVLKAHGVATVAELPFNYDGLIMQAGEEHETQVYARHLDRLRDLHQRQQALQRRLSFLSPTGPMRSLSMGMARTDMAAHDHFTRAAEAYRIDLVRDLNYDLKDNSRYGDWEYEAPSEFFATTTRFDYTPPGWRESRPLLLRDLWSVLGWFVLSGLVWLRFGLPRP